MSIQYPTPAVPAEWANSRETHPAVAMAIHAIADHRRTAEAIWEAPTHAEWENVVSAVEDYVANGVFPAEPDGRYPWGEETIDLGLRYILMAQVERRGEPWDTEMGEFATVAAAEASLPAARAEWDAQVPDDGLTASKCRWYVWDRHTRSTVSDL